MTDEFQTQVIHIGDWVIRQRVPGGKGPFPAIFMFHGWTGDENVMWIYATRMPRNTLLIAPRGLYPTPLGGHGWHAYKAKIWPLMDDFRPSIASLAELLNSSNFPLVDFDRLHFVGFSQGAAMAYAFALEHGERLASVAGLSGFLPERAELAPANNGLRNKPIFIAHGNQDYLVPVYRARESVNLFQKAGARVTYCEDDVGHKLSANCFRGLQTFYANQEF